MRTFLHRGMIAGLLLAAALILPSCALLQKIGLAKRCDTPPDVGPGLPGTELPDGPPEPVAMSDEERQALKMKIHQISRPLSSSSSSFRRSNGRWPTSFEELTEFQPNLLASVDPAVFQDFSLSKSSQNETLVIKFIILEAGEDQRHTGKILVNP